MDLFASPLERALAGARTILVAGAGGGFDLFCGLPLYFALRARGKQVHLGNLSFSRLDVVSGGTRLAPAVLYLARHLRKLGIEQPIYCFEQTGVRPLTEAYAAVARATGIDAVVLVDGGTVEDVASILAADPLPVGTKLLLCVGFGVDTYHGVCHADFLAAVAELTRKDAFLGATSWTLAMPEVRAYREAVTAVHQRMPDAPSIVSSSIVSALEGHFGDHHATTRTAGSELFINPLMSLAWAFRLDAVAARLLYANGARQTQSYHELHSLIEKFRAAHPAIGTWRELPF